MVKIIVKAVLIASLFVILPGCAVNPVTGKQRLMLISEEQELQIGLKYAPEIEKQMGGRIDSPQLQNYINSIGQKLAAVSHRPDMRFSFTALDSDALNAFAMPGGYVFITREMLKNLNSEAELASILSHEIVHVVARHSSEAMSQQIGIDMLVSAAVSNETPQYVQAAADMTRKLISLKYSRVDEKQADIAGAGYMVSAGYNPYAMVETMQMLLEQERARPLEFFSSHPSPQNRIGYITESIRQKYPGSTALSRNRVSYKRYVLDLLGE